MDINTYDPHAAEPINMLPFKIRGYLLEAGISEGSIAYMIYRNPEIMLMRLRQAEGESEFEDIADNAVALDKYWCRICGFETGALTSAFTFAYYIKETGNRYKFDRYVVHAEGFLVDIFKIAEGLNQLMRDYVEGGGEYELEIIPSPEK